MFKCSYVLLSYFICKCCVPPIIHQSTGLRNYTGLVKSYVTDTCTVLRTLFAGELSGEVINLFEDGLARVNM